MCHSTGFNRLGVSLLRAPGPEAGTLDPSEGFKPKAPAAALRKNVRRCGGLHALSSSAWAFRSRGRSYSRFPGTPSATTMCSSVQITLRERASVVATFLFSLRENAKEPGLSYLKPVFPRWPCRFGMAFAHFPCKTQRFHRLLAETTEEPNG